MWTSGEWASGGDALPMEQELLFGEASPKILLLLHARVKGSDLFGCSGKPTRTSVHVSTRWLRIWSKATVVSLMSRWLLRRNEWTALRVASFSRFSCRST